MGDRDDAHTWYPPGPGDDPPFAFAPRLPVRLRRSGSTSDAEGASVTDRAPPPCDEDRVKGANLPPMAKRRLPWSKVLRLAVLVASFVFLVLSFFLSPLRRQLITLRLRTSPGRSLFLAVDKLPSAWPAACAFVDSGSRAPAGLPGAPSVSPGLQRAIDAWQRRFRDLDRKHSAAHAVTNSSVPSGRRMAILSTWYAHLEWLIISR